MSRKPFQRDVDVDRELTHASHEHREGGESRGVVVARVRAGAGIRNEHVMVILRVAGEMFEKSINRPRPNRPSSGGSFEPASRHAMGRSFATPARRCPCGASLPRKVRASNGGAWCFTSGPHGLTATTSAGSERAGCPC